MAKISLEDIQQEQQAMQIMIEELNKTTDQDAFQLIVAELQEAGERLRALAAAFQAQFLEEYAEFLSEEGESKTASAKIEIVLTPGQRRRVFDETGVDMPSLLLNDEVGAWAMNMDTTKPDEIEPLAIQRAHEFNEMVAAQAEAQKELDDAVAAIEANPDPRVQEQLEKLKEDPEFLEGLLAKK